MFSGIVHESNSLKNFLFGLVGVHYIAIKMEPVSTCVLKKISKLYMLYPFAKIKRKSKVVRFCGR